MIIMSNIYVWTINKYLQTTIFMNKFDKKFTHLKQNVP